MFIVNFSLFIFVVQLLVQGTNIAKQTFRWWSHLFFANIVEWCAVFLRVGVGAQRTMLLHGALSALLTSNSLQGGKCGHMHLACAAGEFI